MFAALSGQFSVSKSNLLTVPAKIMALRVPAAFPIHLGIAHALNTSRLALPWLSILAGLSLQVHQPTIVLAVHHYPQQLGRQLYFLPYDVQKRWLVYLSPRKRQSVV